MLLYKSAKGNGRVYHEVEEDIYHVNNADLWASRWRCPLIQVTRTSAVEREFALINAMAAVPIVANGAGKGNEIIALAVGDRWIAPRALLRFSGMSIRL